MKRNLVVALALMYLVGGLASARADKPLRSISVSGTVETKTAPDQILWSVTLTDTDVDMRAAKTLNDAKIKAIVALREKLDVGDADMETGTISIRREYERDPNGGRGAFKHFVVRRSVTIRQRDLMRFDEFLDTLVASSEMEMSFSFQSSQIHELRAETRLKALKAAKDKAEAMAEVVGAKLGKVITIDENPQGGGMQSPYLNNISISQGTPSVDLASEKFVPGAISVRVSVFATFELE